MAPYPPGFLSHLFSTDRYVLLLWQYYMGYRQGRGNDFGVRGTDDSSRPWKGSTQSQGPRPAYKHNRSPRAPVSTYHSDGAPRGRPEAYEQAGLPKPPRLEEDRHWKPDRHDVIDKEERFRGRDGGGGPEEGVDRRGRRDGTEFYSRGPTMVNGGPQSRPGVAVRRGGGRGGGGGRGHWAHGDWNREIIKDRNDLGNSRLNPTHYGEGNRGRAMWTDESKASGRAGIGPIIDRGGHSARHGSRQLGGSRHGHDNISGFRVGENPTSRMSRGDITGDDNCGYYGWGGRREYTEGYYEEDRPLTEPKKVTKEIHSRPVV